MDMTASDDGGPYVGRRAFLASDQDIFFGRLEESAAVRDLWCGRQLAVLHGLAGCGKTSLLQAGAAPLVASDGEVLPLGRPLVVSSFPDSLLAAHNPYSLAVLSSWAPAESRTRLAQESIVNFLRRRSRGVSMLLVAIDQVEQILAEERDGDARNEFFADLAAAISEIPNLRVLFSVRTDALSELLPYEKQLAPAGVRRFGLGSLAPGAAVAAIRCPMESAGHCFGAGVAEYIVDELSENADSGSPASVTSVQPVQLQVVCHELWRTIRTDEPAITLNRVLDTVDVGRILANFCASVVAEASDRYKVVAGQVFQWLTTSFMTSGQSAALVPKAELLASGFSAGMLRLLENEHILTSERRPDGKQYRLANGHLDSAVRHLNQSPVFSQHKLDTAARIRVAELALTSEEFTLARRHLEEALAAADPGEIRLQADALTLLGNIDYRVGKADFAVGKYEQAAALREQLSDQAGVGRLYGAIGSIHIRQGKYLMALEELQLAVTRVPSDLAMQTELATVLWRSGQSQAATAVFGVVLSVEPESAGALAGRGQISAERGHAAEALADLQALRRLRPAASQQPEVRSAYALALAIAGRPESAMAEANAAVAAANDSAVIYMRAARVALAGRSMSRARELLRQAEQAMHPALSSDQRDQVRRLLAEASRSDAAADA